MVHRPSAGVAVEGADGNPDELGVLDEQWRGRAAGPAETRAVARRPAVLRDRVLAGQPSELHAVADRSRLERRSSRATALRAVTEPDARQGSFFDLVADIATQACTGRHRRPSCRM